MHLAIYNFGLPKESFEAESFKGFALREPLNFQAAEEAVGFVARSRSDDEPGLWGDQVFPRFIEGTGFERGVSSLSLWRDIESLMAFSYSGVHAEAIRNRHHWTRKQAWPSLVLWWVAEGVYPQWSEAVRRFEYLHDHGVSPDAFNFKTAFDPDGNPLAINRDKAREYRKINEQRQRALYAKVWAMPV